MKHIASLLFVFSACPLLADETRHLDSHEHGVGTLDIAIDGPSVTMAFRAPGADIVGFEYAAKSAADRAAVDAAVATLARPVDLFVLPAAAACSVTKASAGLESDGADGADGAHTEHRDHADEHAHTDHDDHSEEAGHTEFRAEYTLTCERSDALTQIEFAYFDTFENAREVEVQIITGSGARAFDVERDAPTLDLRTLF